VRSNKIGIFEEKESVSNDTEETEENSSPGVCYNSLFFTDECLFLHRIVKYNSQHYTQKRHRVRLQCESRKYT